MDLGFETIGNATAICHDGGPVLATDPWIVGSAYFGSWIHQHRIPDEQMEAVKACRKLWISHGHPDHLSLESLELLRDKEILLPDHYGGRIARELREQGFDVRVLRCGEWVGISDRIRVLCIADVHQDAALLIDIDGHLVANTNDAGDHGGGELVKKVVAEYDDTYLLALAAYGDADMINFFDEDGNRVPPAAATKTPLGPGIAGLLAHYGIRTYVPFATLHKYQRADSVWTNDYITTPEEIGKGFASETGRMLPAYSRVDFARGEVSSIDPDPVPVEVKAPEEFGDCWSDELEPGDLEKLREYVLRHSHFQRFLGFVNFRVGGKENVVDVARDRFDRGITFETPRASLMAAVEWRIFDDLLIGNFTKTTLHGDWGGKRGTAALYPDFDPFLTKFGDNGGAYTPDELRAYFAEYLRRGHTRFEGEAATALAPYLPT